MTGTTDPDDSELLVPGYEQNHASFRSLNHQMWQIPLISMTLTGGLWFGVSKVDKLPLFQIALLFLAMVGNAALFLVLQRLRFVMEQTLLWLEQRSPSNFVSAKGDHWYNKPLVVRRSFQAMLLLASLVSGGLLVITCLQTDWSHTLSSMKKNQAAEYYDQHAQDLADSYEAISARAAHPDLQEILGKRFATSQLDILDVGAGTGRDAAWLASLGHVVTAVEPSISMQRIARQAHKNMAIRWVFDELPDLSVICGEDAKFDVIILSAVWMHVSPSERESALQSIISLLKPEGIAYVTLRLGPAEPARSIYEVSIETLAALADRAGLEVELLHTKPDLLGRNEISWQSVLLKRAS